jgi:hypothetical protein
MGATATEDYRPGAVGGPAEGYGRTTYDRHAHWKEILQRGSIATFTRPSNPV